MNLNDAAAAQLAQIRKSLSLKSDDAKKNEALLKLLNDESKASLNNIKDTLERLVQFKNASGGNMDANLEKLADELRQAVLRADFVEIPSVDAAQIAPSEEVVEAAPPLPPPPPPAVKPAAERPSPPRRPPPPTPGADTNDEKIKQTDVQTDLTYPPRPQSPALTLPEELQVKNSFLAYYFCNILTFFDHYSCFLKDLIKNVTLISKFISII